MLENRQQEGQVCRIVLKVGVECRGNLAAHRGESGRERGALAVMPVEDQDPDKGIPPRHLRKKFPAPIRAAIVDKDNLVRTCDTSQRFFKLRVKLLEVLDLIVDGDNHRDFGLACHEVAAPSVGVRSLCRIEVLTKRRSARRACPDRGQADVSRCPEFRARAGWSRIRSGGRRPRLNFRSNAPAHARDRPGADR